MTEVALALILLIGSALLIRTALALGRVDPGFDADNVLTMRMSLSGPQFQKSEAVSLLVANGVERLKALSRCRARQRHVLRPAPGRIRPAVHHLRASARRRSVSRRRRLDDRVAGLFRGVPHPDQARADVHRSGQRGRPGRRHHQRGDGAAILAGQRSAGRPARHRTRDHARVRRRAGAPNHRRRRRLAGRRAEPEPGAADVRPAIAAARPRQRVERATHADRPGSCARKPIRWG